MSYELKFTIFLILMIHLDILKSTFFERILPLKEVNGHAEITMYYTIA